MYLKMIKKAGASVLAAAITLNGAVVGAAGVSAANQ